MTRAVVPREWRAPSGIWPSAPTCLWMIAQALGVYNDLRYRTPSILPLANLLFSFWFAPLAMALFLDPEHETGRLDALMALDFGQGVLVCVAAYLVFLLHPEGRRLLPSLSHSVWIPYFGGYGLVATAFILRCDREPLARCACSVRPHGNLPRLLRLRRCALLLRARPRHENRRSGSIFSGACC